MANYAEPMDIDEVPVDSEDKENVFRHKWPSGVPCTPPDKASDLDVSEMNMRLRLSCTPLASPTPNKRFTGSAKKLFPESGDNESLNNTLTNTTGDVTMMELSMGDNNRSYRLSEDATFTSSSYNDALNGTTILQSTESASNSTISLNPVNNATPTLEDKYNCNDVLNAPESPDKLCSTELLKPSTSPIMRGLKSVFSMFRTSQSPITPEQICQNTGDVSLEGIDSSEKNICLVSTPVYGGSKSKEPSPSKITPSRSGESIVFNEDLINDLQWNDDSTIIFNKLPTPNNTASIHSIETLSKDVKPSSELANLDRELTKIDVLKITNDINDTKVHVKTESENTTSIKHKHDYSQEYVMQIVNNLLDSVFEQAEKSIEKKIESPKSNLTEINIVQSDKELTSTLFSCIDSIKLNSCTDQNNVDSNSDKKLNLTSLPGDHTLNSESHTVKLCDDLEDKVNAHVSFDVTVCDNVTSTDTELGNNDTVNLSPSEVVPDNNNEEIVNSFDLRPRVTLSPQHSATEIEQNFECDENDINNEAEAISNESVMKDCSQHKEHITLANMYADKVCDMKSSLDNKFISSNVCDPFAIKSRLSVSPPKVVTDINEYEIQNNFISRSRVTMSPVKPTNENVTDDEISKTLINNESEYLFTQSIIKHDNIDNDNIAPDNTSSDTICHVKSSTDGKLVTSFTKPKSSIPPKTNIDKNDLENPFVSRPRVTMSPIHTTNQTIVEKYDTEQIFLAGNVRETEFDYEGKTQLDNEDNQNVASGNTTFDRICDKQSNTDSELVTSYTVDPFATKSKLSLSPTKTVTDKDYEEFENPFISRPRVTMSPVHTTNQNLVRSHEIIEEKIIEEVEIPPNQLINDQEEHDEIIDVAEIDNLQLSLGCIGIENFCDDDIHSVDAKEQSDAYLSADSGRESEQLLDSEIENENNEQVKNGSMQKNLTLLISTSQVYQKDSLNCENEVSKSLNKKDIPVSINESINCKTHDEKYLQDSSVSHISPKIVVENKSVDEFFDTDETLATSSPNLVKQTFKIQVDKDGVFNDTCFDKDMCNFSTEDNSENLNPFERINKINMSPSTTPTKELSRNDIHELDKFMQNLKLNNTYTDKFTFTENKNDVESTFVVDVNPVERTFVLNDNAIENTFVLEKHDAEQTFITNGKHNLDITVTSETKMNKTFASNSSSLSDHDTTLKEVRTEDEDTIEGPDIEKWSHEAASSNSELTNAAANTEKAPFKSDNNKKDQIPEIIFCSDLKSSKSGFEELTSEEEFLECNDEEFKPGELFINANTFDFLMNKGSGFEGIDSGKESLFLKFDPLCTQERLHTNSLPSINEPHQPSQENWDVTQTQLEQLPINTIATPKESTNLFDKNQVRDSGSSTSTIHTTPEKPMMAVLPAINNEPSITTRIAPHTPVRLDRPTFSSPAIAAIDRLISLSGNNSPANQTYYMDNVGGSHETREAILHLQDMLTEKEIEVAQLKQETKELKDRLTDLEIQMKSLMEDNEERLKKINELKSKLTHKTALNKNMSAVVEEYERTISGMIADNEQEKQRHEQERADLIRERDEQIAHLNSMEISFNDLHTKYERAKQLIITFKANEEALRTTLEKFQDNQKKLENNYDTLKQQAMSKLNSANLEFDKIKRSHEAEVVKLTAQLKRKELHISSLEESVAQKNKENEDLTAICDELISKVS